MTETDEPTSPNPTQPAPRDAITPPSTRSTKPQTDLDLWPIAGLRARSGDLELRYLDDALLLELAHLAADGVHAPEAMPFMFPWTRGTPLEVARSVLAYQWGARARATAQALTLELAVVRHDDSGTSRVVGVQSVELRDFAVTRSVETGSWLGLRHQGRGTGTRMRALMLHLAFEGLGAEQATTTAFADNAASNGVTRRLGYTPDGTDVVVREGERAVSNRYRLTREAWAARPDRPAVQLHGLEPVRAFLGLDAPVT